MGQVAIANEKGEIRTEADYKPKKKGSFAPI
jgi:hypothetical protein